MLAEGLKMLFDKCDNCGIRPKAKDKKLCQRCIDRFRRKQGLNIQAFASGLPIEYLTAELIDFAKLSGVLEKWDMQENLFFTGNTGTGKTRAMYALMKKCYAAGCLSKIVEFMQVCSDIRETYNTDSKTSENKIIKSLAELDVLFVDDLGLQSGISDFAYLTFYRIINARIMQGLTTVISSNKTPEQIGAMFDKRIASRLNEFRVIEFSGEDFRAKARTQNTGKQ